MENSITSTLFRFVSFRSPEPPSSSANKSSFIVQPDLLKEGVFYQAIADKPATDSKKSVLEEAAAAFSDKLNSPEDADAISDGLYGLGNWIAVNRSNFDKIFKGDYHYDDDSSYADLKKELAKADTLSPEKRLKFWNNLVYQTVTENSFYTKEAIMMVLLGDHLSRLISEGGQGMRLAIGTETISKDQLRDTFNAKVVLPAELFDEYSVVPPQHEAEPSEALQVALPDFSLSKQLATNEAVVRLNSYKALLSELEVSERKYYKEYSESYDVARSAYESSIAPALQQYNTDLKAAKDAFCAVREPGSVYNPVDPCAQPPAVAFPPLQPFEFTAAKPITAARMEQDLSYVSFATLKGLMGYNFEQGQDDISAMNISDDEVFAKVNGYGDLYTKINSATALAGAIMATNFPQFKKRVSIGGAAIPVNTQLTLAPYAFTLCASRVNLSSVFTLKIGTPNTDTGIISIKVTANLADNSTTVKTISAPKVSKSSGTLTLSSFYTYTFTGGNLLNAPKLEFEISFTDGCKKIIKNVEANMQLCVKGTAIGPCPTPTQTISTGFTPSGFGFKDLGIADYRKVEQSVQCYVEGEVSHIENIMAREYKEKSTRVLRRSEDTNTVSNETEREKLSDTTTAERFEMQSEISKVLSEMKDSSGFVNLGYSSNGMSLNTGLAFANNKSKEDSIRQSQIQSQEITERALDRVVAKVKEERITKIIEEFEENNKHGYDNRQGAEHVVGVYRWVDKLYKNQIVNYGKRMMFEFMVPEPAKMHLLGIADSDEDIEYDLTAPEDPRTFYDAEYRLSTFLDVSLGMAAVWGAKYNVEIEKKPEYNITVGESFSIKWDQVTKISYVETNSGNGKVTIPEGYKAISFGAIFNAVSDGDSHDGHLLSVTVGDQTTTFNGTFGDKTLKMNPYSNLTGVGSYMGDVPVSFTLGNHVSGDISVSVTCVATEEFINDWRQRTFKAIIDGYEKALLAFNEKKALHDTKTETLKTVNPGFYRQIENTVLRKNCISYLIDQNPNAAYTYGKKMYKGDKFSNYEVNVNQALSNYASFVKFIEQAFEWEIMSYNFYPYYWGDRNNWKDLYTYNGSDDQLFRSFMQSGMARVIVTVRPGFEEAVALYMSTGKLWNGGETPVIGNPLYVSIVEEVKQAKSIAEGKPWITRVPTALTILQAGSIGLKVEKALPCDCEAKKILRIRK